MIRHFFIINPKAGIRNVVEEATERIRRAFILNTDRENEIYDIVLTKGKGDATELARKMITKFGMSERLGLVTYGNDNNEVFLGRDFSSTPNYSEKTSAAIDEEIEKIVMTQYNKAISFLNDAMPKLHEVAKILFENEKISGDDFRAIMENN